MNKIHNSFHNEERENQPGGAINWQAYYRFYKRQYPKIKYVIYISTFLQNILSKKIRIAGYLKYKIWNK